MGGPRIYANIADRKRAHSRRHYRKFYKASGLGLHIHQAPPPEHVLIGAAIRNATPHDSIVAAISGDPKPGQSALDRKKNPL